MSSMDGLVAIRRIPKSDAGAGAGALARAVVYRKVDGTEIDDDLMVVVRRTALGGVSFWTLKLVYSGGLG